MSTTVETFNRYLNTTVGREKLWRFVQYFSRFYVFYLFRTGASKDTIQRWNDLKNNVSIARKFFRLFKQFEFGSNAAKSLALPDEVLKTTGALKQIGMLVYYTCEALVLANTVKFYKFSSAPEFQKFGFKAWLFALCMSVISSLYKHKRLAVRAHMLQKREGVTEEKQNYEEEAASLVREKKAVNKQLVQDLIDMVIPVAGLNIIGFDEGIVGIAGMITSSMAIHAQWQKSQPK
ncbi:hypothetical protein LRAMOSA10065 [Lichtheimia ramosa]|uniref:Peroxisomal biogenesis factor 11 n=1 Tax=Lichtheimia ramosa TaxID=688394 RepID=A0A077WNM5_9FUNG|nr:hypothetical protein LRAMOSA10065 [Lichtheimia ramosa]